MNIGCPALRSQAPDIFWSFSLDGISSIYLNSKSNTDQNTVASNKRVQPEANILLFVRRWVRKFLSSVVRPELWTASFVSRTLVGLALFLWLMILILGFFPVYEEQVPQLAFLPLYAFYPGEILSGQPNSNPVFLHAWGIGAGIVYLALAVFAVFYKKKSAAIAFIAVFLISTLIVYARVVDQVRYFHLHQLH